MELKTERLRLMPLELQQFRLFLEKEAAARLSLELQIALMCLYAKAAEHADSFLYHTLWSITDCQSKDMVGVFFFKGLSNKAQRSEIGYTIFPEFQQRGYMKEALQSVTSWALGQGGIKLIAAEADKDNLASQRVLEHCGFVRSCENSIAFLYEKSN